MSARAESSNARSAGRSSRAGVRAGLFAIIAALVPLLPATAWAQACCAGSGAVTPGRLSLHEDALVGLQLRAAHVMGSFDARGRYASPSPGASEQDFEQDLIGAVRLPFAPRAQVAALVPLVETRRKTSSASDFGGGLGDLNVSARYDFFYAGQARYIPGVAVLAGLTLPTGRPPESGSLPLAADVTGTGAYQINAGLAVEQTFGRWLVTAYGLVAKRTSRTIQGFESTLGTQWTALLAVAYTFPGDYAAALSASYTGEGDAAINGVDAPNSSRRVPVIALFGVVPFSDHFRLQGGPSLNPPVDQLGKNNVATLALTATAVYAWF